MTTNTRLEVVYVGTLVFNSPGYLAYDISSNPADPDYPKKVFAFAEPAEEVRIRLFAKDEVDAREKFELAVRLTWAASYKDLELYVYPEVNNTEQCDLVEDNAISDCSPT